MAVRDENGKFLPGHSAAGPGRPKRIIEMDYLAAMKEEITFDHWRAICRRARIDAIKGNGTARSWISDYLIGKPPQILDIRATDAKLLAELLKQLEAAGMSPSEVFNEMLAELVSEEAETHE